MNDWVLPVESHKIVKFGNPTHTLVASSGVGGLGQFTKHIQLKHSTQGAPQVVSALIEDLCNWQVQQDYQGDDVRFLLLVSKPDILAMIDSKGVYHEVAKHQDYWCIGSGDELCLGFLAGLVADPQSKRAGDVSAIDAVHAIRYTATRIRGVSAESDTEFL